MSKKDKYTIHSHLIYQSSFMSTQAIYIRKSSTQLTTMTIYQSHHYTKVTIIPKSPLYQSHHYTKVTIIPKSPLYQSHHYTKLVTVHSHHIDKSSFKSSTKHSTVYFTLLYRLVLRSYEHVT